MLHRFKHLLKCTFLRRRQTAIFKPVYLISRIKCLYCCFLLILKNRVFMWPNEKTNFSQLNTMVTIFCIWLQQQQKKCKGTYRPTGWDDCEESNNNNEPTKKTQNNTVINVLRWSVMALNVWCLSLSVFAHRSPLSFLPSKKTNFSHIKIKFKGAIYRLKLDYCNDLVVRFLFSFGFFFFIYLFASSIASPFYAIFRVETF